MRIYLRFKKIQFKLEVFLFQQHSLLMSLICKSQELDSKRNINNRYKAGNTAEKMSENTVRIELVLYKIIPKILPGKPYACSFCTSYKQTDMVTTQKDRNQIINYKKNRCFYPFLLS